MRAAREGLNEQTRQVPLRLPLSLLERVERHVLRMRAQNPGVDVRRADALRSLLATALDAAEGRRRAAPAE